MTELDLAAAARLARTALEGGPEVAIGVVVEAADPALVGRRIARGAAGLLGTLGSAALDAAADAALAAAPAGGACADVGGATLFVERVGAPAALVIVGAGHVAQPLAAIGALLGWAVTVLDDRPEWARAERFPGARVIVADFADPFAGVAVGPATRLVLVTRGHRHDYDCLKALAAMGAEPAYVGMIGSGRRVRAAFEQLAAEGFDAAWLARVHAPIGLDLGGESPAEIAVAIAAEIVLATNPGARGRARTGRPLAELADVVRHVKALREGAGKGAP